MMNDFFSSMMKGLSELMPGDDPCIRAFQLQNEITKLKEKENELYLELGKKVFEENANDYPREQEQLSSLKKARKEAEDELEDIQFGKEKKKEESSEEEIVRCVCSVCNAVNPSENTFCQECGAKLGEAAVKKCPGCGMELESDVKFCGKCGSKAE